MRKILLSIVMALPALILLSCGGGDLSVSAVVTTPESLQASNGFTNLQFTAPVFMTALPSGEDVLYVVEQAGRIFVFDNDPNEAETDVF
jgi:hypothetical protein